MIYLDIPENLKFKYKAQTNLYDLSNIKTSCLSLAVSEDGELFGTFTKDKHIRVFKYLTGELYREYNESLKFYVETYADIIKNEFTKIEKTEFDRKLATEKEIEKYIDVVPPINVQFDETSQFIMYSSILGIKLIDLYINKTIKILGKPETGERFLTINLFQGKAQKVFIYFN
jgi:peptidylprolyl isomerase domain and WD repeat-containing protein 1